MGMRLKGRRMNDLEITRKSPGNHPVITPFSRLISSALLLLFTFAIGNVWGAASSVIPATPDYKDISTVATDGTYTFTCSSDNIKNAANATSSWIGWYSTQSSFKEYDKSGSALCMGTQTKIPNLKYDKVYFYVTNCTSFEIQAWGNGDNRHVNYSYQATDAASATEDSFTSADNKTCASSGEISLDASKSYTIIVWNDTGTEEIGVTYMVFNTNSGGDPVAVTGITIAPSPVAVKVGKTTTLSATVTPSNATDKAVTWAVTSGSSYASVTDAGVVTGLEEGTAVITATAHDGSGVSQDVTVNVTASSCPSSGELFAITVTSSSTVRPPRATDSSTPGWLALDDYATISGSGEAKAGNKATGSDKGGISSTAVNLDGNDGVFWIALECELEEGDVIEASVTGNTVYLTPDCSRASGISLATGTESKYTITGSDKLVGKSNIYFWKGGGSAKIASLTITRPAPAATYNATFENGGHGTAPADATGVSSVTLTELTESGWINTGWKADKATKVGTTDKAAGATLNIGDKVTLLDHTTFTAQWEAEKQTPEVTFNDGAYVVGASALDLSSLFTSQNESAISFALKVASDDATVSGKNFTATKEGSYVIVATQPADATYKAVSKEATMVVTYPATGAATIIYNVAVGTSQATLATASKEDNSASISNLVGFTAVDIATRTGNGKAKSSPKLETPQNKVQNKYVSVTFDVAEGKEFVLDSVVTKMVAVTSSKTIEIVISDTEGTKDSLNYEQGTNNDPGAAHQFNFTSSAKAYQGTVTVKIYAYGATDDYRIGKPLKVCGTVKAATPKFAVSFAKGGADGSETMSPVNYEVGAQVTAPDCDFTYTDHIFREWAVTGVAGVTSVAAGGKFNMPNNAVTLTAQWLANNYEAKIGTTFYATLAEALLYAADGEIELLKNVDVTSQVEIAAGVTATIDLAGYKIEYTGTETLPSGVILVHNGASLTINDSSDPDAGSVVAGAKAYAAVALTKLDDDAENPATLIINGGTFTGLYYAITGNGARHNTNTTINGGTFTATATNDNLAIFHPQNGTLTINGGTFTGYASAIEMRAGTLVINDGTFTATATEFSCNPSGSGSTTVGAAIAIAQHTTKKDISVTINGGTFNGVKAINEANPQGNPDPAITMSVTAGTFTGEVSTVDVNKFISGGTFDAPVAVANCAENYAPKNNGDGTYGVKPLAQTFSLEDLVTSEGKSADYTEYLNGLGWTVSNANALDGIDTDKPYDNYPYLGLKFKNNTGYVAGSVEGGKLLTIKLGHMAGVAHLIVDDVKKAELNGKDAADPAVHYYYVENAANVKVLFANAGSSATCVLKAIAVTDPYEVTFNANGGDEIAAQFFYGTALTLPGATKGTESFLGWFDGETKVGEAGDKYTPTANITLKAHWEAISTDARLASITFSSNAGTLSPAFDPEVTNYTYTMPYGTAAVPTITGATKANPAAKAPVIDAQATAWGETAHVHGVAASDDTKDYYVRMLRAPKDGTCIVKADLAPGSSAASITATSGAYKDEANIAINVAKDLKLGETGAYVKVAVTDTYFQDGDVVEITLASDKNASAWLQIFADEGTTLVAEMTSGVSNASPNYLTISGVPANTSALYLYRTETAAGNMNPYPTSMAVLRAMNPKLKSITIDGTKINVTSTTVSETLPYGANLTAVTPEYYWNGAGTAVVTTNGGNWAWGENTYVLTDKDGEATTYTITLTKAEHYEAKIGETGYATLVKAVEEAVDGDVIVLQENVAAGAGVMIAKADAKQITIDFGGYTYTANSPAVGSVGTQNQAFHFEKGCDITLKNGTITSEGSVIKMLVQNYGDLTLENITLDGTGLPGSHAYVLSNNCGDVVIGDGATITAKTDDVAFDVCATNYYPEGVTVTVKNGATVNGIVEYDVWGTKPADNKAELAIEGGTLNITWNVESALAEDAKSNLNVSGGQFSEIVPADYCAPGYAPVTTPNAQGKYEVQDVRVVIFDGSTMSDLATSPSGAISWAKVSSTMGAGDKDKTYKDVHYTRALSCGSSSKTKHFRIDVKENTNVKIEVIGMSNSSSDTRHAWLTNSTEKGEYAAAIAGLESEGYNPAEFETEWLEEGSYYLHADNTVAIFLIRVTPKAVPARCEVPTIATQPATKLDFGAGAMTATVVASVEDGGTLKYQWYNAANNEAVAGATEATLSTTTEGTYYVVVTNTLAEHRDNSVKSAEAQLAHRVMNDATLSSLSASAGTLNPAFDKDVEEYRVDLPEGTAVVPTLIATATMDGYANVDINNADAFVDYEATSTVVVTSEDGTANKTYTVLFKVAHQITTLVDVTESTTWDWTTITNDVDGNAIGSNGPTLNGANYILANYIQGDNWDKIEGNNGAYAIRNGSDKKVYQGASLHFHTTKAGLLTVKAGNEGHDMVLKVANAGRDYELGALASTRKDYMVYVEAGDVTVYNVPASGTSPMRVEKMTFTVKETPDYTRNVSNNIGTLCVDHNVLVGGAMGATFYQIASRNELYDYKIDFEEVLPNEELKAGEPYIFKSNTGKIELFYGTTVADAPVAVRGMHGWFSNTDEFTMLDITAENKSDILYIAQNKLWNCEDLVDGDLKVVNNRAYIVMSEVPTYADYVASQNSNNAPRRRVTLSKDEAQVATGFGELETSETPMKVMINGQIFIIRGEKMFDVTGKLVK